MIEKIKNFLKDEEGASMVEYALLVSLIAIACLAALTAMGVSISGLFTQVSNAL